MPISISFQIRYTRGDPVFGKLGYIFTIKFSLILPLVHFEPGKQSRKPRKRLRELGVDASGINFVELVYQVIGVYILRYKFLSTYLFSYLSCNSQV